MASLKWFSLNGPNRILTFSGNQDIRGDINFTGNLYKNGVLYSEPGFDPFWQKPFAGKLYFTAPAESPSIPTLVGVGTTNPQYTLDVTGDINFTGNIYKNGELFSGGGGGGSGQWSVSGSDIYYNAGKVGVGTTSPQSIFHLFDSTITIDKTKGLRIGDGSTFAHMNYVNLPPSGKEYFYIQAMKETDITDRNISLNPQGGNVGIGKTNPTYKLEVNGGDINIIGGGLRINGTLVSGGTGPTWQSISTTLYYAGGNVGIGTTGDTNRLAVDGSINVFTGSSYKINNVDVLSDSTLGNSVTNSSLLSVGYMTNLNVDGDVGIGTESPAYKLDVVGDINFSGDLYQGGVLFSGGGGSSQWVTLGGNIYYDAGNVGISTDSPSSSLHIGSSDSLFSRTNGLRIGVGTYGMLGAITGGLENYFSIQGATDSTTDIPVILNALGGYVGVGTGIPAYTLDVTGDLNFTGDLYKNGVLVSNSSQWTTMGSDIYFDTGNVGIGTNNPIYDLDITGDLNFTGNIYQNGVLFTGVTAWNFAGSDIYFNAGSVGIGTNLPAYDLDVTGDINFTGDIYKGGVLFSTSQWTTNLTNIYYTTGAVGIGTTDPGYDLDVVGDINFSGNLYQGGVLFSGGGGSQWTTSGSDIYFNAGNVGIGTTADAINRLTIGGSTNLLTGNTYKIDDTDVLSSTTLGAGVTSSSLTSVGTLTSLDVANDFTVDSTVFTVNSGLNTVNVGGDFIVDTSVFKVDTGANKIGINTVSPNYVLDVYGPINIIPDTGHAYKFNGVDVLTGTTLGSGVTSSSLTSVGTLSSLVVSGNLQVDTETLFVNSTTNRVGVGTTTPQTALHVVSATPNLIRVETTVNDVGQVSGIEFGIPAYNTNTRSKIISTTEGSDANILQFFTSSGTNLSAERMRITALGKVGIGSTAPTEILDVVGNVKLSGSLLANSGEGIRVTGAGVNIFTDFDFFDDPSTAVTQGATVRFFRDTNTTGAKTVTFFRGNNTTNISASIGVDGANSFFQMNGGNLGIGSSSPTQPLDVVGNAVVSGNVGIGTVIPLTKLHIKDVSPIVRLESTAIGASTLTEVNTGLELVCGGMNTTSQFTPAIKFMTTDPDFTTENPRFMASIVGRAEQAFTTNTAGSMSLFFGTNNITDATGDPTTRMVIRGDGKVGIGSTIPTEILDVVGNAVISGNLQVDTNTLFVNSTLNSVGIGTSSGLGATGRPFTVFTGSGNNMDIAAQPTSTIGIGNGSASGVSPFISSKGSTIQGLSVVAYHNDVVGVGTDQVASAASQGFNFELRSNGGSSFTNTTNPAYQFSIANSPSIIRALTILRSGNVGVGRTNPTTRFHVESPATANQANGNTRCLFGNSQDNIIDVTDITNPAEIILDNHIEATFTSTVSRTFTQASTVRIAGPPLPGSNVSITNFASLYVVSGDIRHNAAVWAAPSGSAPLYSARAWVKFNGSTGAINGNGNVSSITINGTGDYTVTFTTAIGDTNYSVTANTGDGSTSGFDRSVTLGTATSGSIRIFVRNVNTGVAVNSTVVSVAVFR